MTAAADPIGMPVKAGGEGLRYRAGLASMPVAALSPRQPSWRIRLRALAVLMIACGTLISTGASATQWTVSGSVSGRTEVDTNKDLKGSPAPIYGATARLGLQAAAISGRSRFGLRTGVSARAFGGPGDHEGLSGTHPDLQADYVYNGKYIDAGTNVSLRYEPVSFAQIDETGITDGDAIELRVGAGSFVSYALTPRDRVTAGANLSLVRFTEGTTSLRPTTTIGGNFGWSRAIAHDTSWNLSLGARRFTANKPRSEERMTFDLMTGMQHRFTPRFSTSGGIGVTATETTDGSGYSYGFAGDFSAAWRPARDTSYSVAFSHGIEPSSIGLLRTSTSLGVGMVHNINSWTDFGLSAGWSRRSNVGGTSISSSREDDSDRFRLGSSLNFVMARNLTLGLGYGLVLETDGDGGAVGNRVFMQLTRRFSIIP